MIFEVAGDLLLTSAPVIVHGVAPNDPFHAGLALQLRERYPAMYKDFRHYCQQTHVDAGHLWAWSGIGPHGPVRIISLLTQDGDYTRGAKPGRARLEHVNHALRNLAKWIEREKPTAVALPKLSTGIGGLKWEDVFPLLRQHLSKCDIPIFVYTTYQRGVRAKEPALLAHT